MSAAPARRFPAPAGGPVDQPPAPPALPVPVPDVHCHLDLMDQPVEDVVAAAAAVGVRPLVTIGIDVPSSRWSARCATGTAGVYAGVAIHPNEAAGADDDALAEIERLAALPEVRAVGETGLDHFRTAAEGWSRQEESFRAHIAIAKRVGKALVIHDRDAHADVLRVLAEEGAPERTVFHCFSGDERMAAECAAGGYVMSFAGNVTFKNAGPLRAAAAAAPLELLLVETDAPFLTPAPFRGRPNAPYLVPLTVRCLADIKNVDIETLGSAVAQTASRVFSL